MGIRGVQQLYRTEPLKCWNKAKELRQKHYRDTVNAREEGKILSSGSLEAFTELIAGFGEHVHMASEPYGASIGSDPEFSRQCVEALEFRGYARDFCAYTRNYLGSVLINKYYFGGNFPKPDFCYQAHSCDTHGKWLQAASEIMGIPYFCIEMPIAPHGLRLENRINYLSSQFYDAIDWLRKTTRKEFDDERFARAVENSFISTKLWAEVCAYNRHIPAPMNQKSIFSFYVPLMADRESDETLKFYRELRDELRYRTENNIAALAAERCRLLDDAPPPWYFLDLYRHLERYGVVVLGSTYTFGLTGAWEDGPDGTMTPKKTPMEKGIRLKSRDDYIRALARWGIERLFYFMSMAQPDDKSVRMLQMVKEWNVDGVLFHLNRGCEGLAFGQKENRMYLSQAGIPSMVYEGNCADKREFDEKKVLSLIDTFMESLGLKKLEKEA